MSTQNKNPDRLRLMPVHLFAGVFLVMKAAGILTWPWWSVFIILFAPLGLALLSAACSIVGILLALIVRALNSDLTGGQ